MLYQFQVYSKVIQLCIYMYLFFFKFFSYLKVKVAQPSDSLRPHGLYSSWNSPGQNTAVGRQPFPSPGDLPNPGTEPGSLALQADSLPTELSGKVLTNDGSCFYFIYVHRSILIIYSLSYERLGFPLKACNTRGRMKR